MRRLLATALASFFAFSGVALAASDPLRAKQWGLDIVEADAAHGVSTGQGAVVAVVDTGVLLAHPDLRAALLPGKDFVENDDTPDDRNGHGTHVAGIVAAATGNGVGVASVAPAARILPVRVLGSEGGGSTSDVAKGIDWAVAQGADVINLSLSTDMPLPGDDRLFEDAVDRALDAGVVVVAAAGNSGLPLCENPSAEGRLLCVGAVDRRRLRSHFSSFGSGLGLMAPGGANVPGAPEEDILSTYTSPEYDYIAGTSQATPHVSGAAALLAAEGVRVQAAVRRILATASDAGAPGADPEYGAGIVNARAAVAGLGGGGGPGGGGDAGSAADVSAPRVQRIRTVLRRGILVRCRAAGEGRCTATASARGRRIARGSGRLAAGRTKSFRVPLTRSGRRLLRRASRVRARVTFSLPGAGPLRRSVTLKR